MCPLSLNVDDSFLQEWLKKKKKNDEKKNLWLFFEK